MQKWDSNCPELLIHVSSAIEEATSTVKNELTLHKILGLVWERYTSSFHFFAELSSNIKITKRSILLEIVKPFDLLGFISSVLIRVKLIIQELWLLKTSWDEFLPLCINIG